MRSGTWRGSPTRKASHNKEANNTTARRTPAFFVALWQALMCCTRESRDDRPPNPCNVRYGSEIPLCEPHALQGKAYRTQGAVVVHRQKVQQFGPKQLARVGVASRNLETISMNETPVWHVDRAYAQAIMPTYSFNHVVQLICPELKRDAERRQVSVQRTHVRQPRSTTTVNGNCFDTHNSKFQSPRTASIGKSRFRTLPLRVDR